MRDKLSPWFMIFILAVILGAALFLGSAIAAVNTFRWNHVTTNEDGSPATDISHYTLSCSASGNFDTPDWFVTVEDASCNHQATEHQCVFQSVHTIAPGEYQCSVRATDTDGNGSVWPTPVALTVIPSPPSPPTGLVVEVQVAMRWQAPDDAHQLVGYRVYRQGSQADRWQRVADLGPEATEFNIAHPRGAYAYRVSAVYADLSEHPTKGVSVSVYSRIEPAPKAPGTVEAT